MPGQEVGRVGVREIVLGLAAVTFGVVVGVLIGRAGLGSGVQTWQGTGQWLSEWIRTPGFGGAAAVVAAVIAYAGVRRNVRVQREASRKEHWWDRARWALDLTLSDDPEEREVGFAVLDALADSEWAQEHESDVIAAATEPALAAYRAQQVAVGTDVDEAQWDPDEEEAADGEDQDPGDEGRQGSLA